MQWLGLHAFTAGGTGSTPGQGTSHVVYGQRKKKERKENVTKNSLNRASLVAQWLRVCLLMQGAWVRALAWEDPTCRGAAGPVSHNC